MDDLKWTVIIAVVPVRMVQVAVDEIVDVVTVGNLRMPTVRAMDMADGMAAASMSRSTAVRVNWRHREYTFVDMIAVQVMQMAVMQVVDVSIVVNGRVATARAVRMFVISDFGACRHAILLDAVGRL